MQRFENVNERGNLLVVSIVLACGLWLGGCDTSKSAPPPPVPEVAVVSVQTERVVLTTALPGRTSAYSMAEIRPQVGGIIQKRLFEEGSEIKAGQVLYQIDPAPLQAAYDNAAANLAAARKAADRARAGLAGSRTGVVRQRAVVENARVNRKRFEDLVAEGAVSASQRDQAVADADVADATLLTTEAQVESDREALGAAEAGIQQAEAALQTTRINLGYARLTAPIGGRIGKSMMTVGALVMAGQPTPLATIQ
ncbi:MAG TPA: biotin/lipoyl-binding protein, partial [Candidatus Methylomirabilis sp.]